MLGHLTLVEIQVEKEKTDEDDLSVLTLDDTVETEIAGDDNELFDLLMEDETEASIDTVEDSLNVITEDTDILDLGLSDKESEVFVDKPVSDDTSEILVDIDKVCQQIGVSHEDYDTFLNEYIDTALGLEQDLQSADSTKRSNAVATLSHLGEVLQLPVIGDIIAKVDTVPENEQKETIESFYAALSRITTAPTSQAEPEMELFDTQDEAKIDLFDVEEEVKPEVTVNENSFGTISLEGIKPIHFDFQLEEAANDLSLPVELIEEFVHDFIEQAHIETEKMLKAYEEGDLDAIQKIGHLLKGASSNLRINALSDTLYKIQFCEDSNDLEHLIKDYWGHFLSFEIQINALAK
jgi:HPt (histidine-containing phosphotransfer) domain-containing protein